MGTGAAVGIAVGTLVGGFVAVVGCEVGTGVGMDVGAGDGPDVVGVSVGVGVGKSLGAGVGAGVGVKVSTETDETEMDDISRRRRLPLVTAACEAVMMLLSSVVALSCPMMCASALSAPATDTVARSMVTSVVTLTLNERRRPASSPPRRRRASSTQVELENVASPVPIVASIPVRKTSASKSVHAIPERPMVVNTMGVRVGTSVGTGVGGKDIVGEAVGGRTQSDDPDHGTMYVWPSTSVHSHSDD